MTSSAGIKTIVFGPEFGDRLRTALREVMQQPPADAPRYQRGVGGSQVVETLDVEIDGAQVRIEAETYVGISVTGPVDLVDRIHDAGRRTRMTPHTCACRPAALHGLHHTNGLARPDSWVTPMRTAARRCTRPSIQWQQFCVCL